MNTFKVTATQTVVWISSKTDRPMKPASRLAKFLVHAESISDAVSAAKIEADSDVTKDQKRVVSLTGITVTMLDHNNESNLGRILSITKL